MNRILNYILNIQTALAQASGSGSSAGSATGNQVTNLADTIIQSFPYWVTGFVVIILSFIIARIVKATVENRMAEAGIEEEHREVQLVVGRTVNVAVLLIGITAGLKIMGLDLTSIIAAAAFGVGFAMQNFIMNFVSGIIILLQKQFTIGDWVKVNGTEGIIKEIQSRFTIIKKFDGTNVVVPNADLFNNQVNSLTTNPERRFTVDIAVDLYMDLKEVIDQLYESIDKCDKILKHPKPSIIVQAPGPYYNSIRIRAWVVSKKGILRPISALIRQIHKDFYRKGWAFPYQVNHLYFDKDVAPNIPDRAKNYIESHKSALKKASGIVQQQQNVLAQQEQNPVQNPMPQAQQIGMGGAQMETPVWLQQAANQNLQPQTADVAQNQMPQAYVQNIEIGPEVKNVQSQQPAQNFPMQNQQPQQDSTPSVAMPIVAATDVEHPQAAASTVAMPLPDVQVPIGENQQNPQS